MGSEQLRILIDELARDPDLKDLIDEINCDVRELLESFAMKMGPGAAAAILLKRRRQRRRQRAGGE
jgi:hypothetical protein